MNPLNIGERVIVQGIMYATAIVSKVEFLPKENRYAIYLDWGEFGSSKIYDTDEGSVWYRYQSSN